MNTLKTGGLDAALVKRMSILVSKAYSYCTRRCGKWGSPNCFSCIFRDVRKLHKDIADGTDDDRQGGGVKADAVQLVRTQDNEARQNPQPRGQVNTEDMRASLAGDAAQAKGVGPLGRRRLPEVRQEGVPQRQGQLLDRG